jgi:poly(3-hydroxybutyrate) depolymerase
VTRNYRLFVLVLAGLFAGCGEQAEPVSDAGVASFNVDTNRISVSGVSAGAYMATQVHIAHSSLFGGAAAIAGGPYYCAEGSIKRGLGPCMKGGDLAVERLVKYARQMESEGNIDALDNLADDRVWLFHGTLDNIMSEQLSLAAAEFYTQLIPGVTVTSVNNDVEAVHGLPTLATGPACDTFATPFMNACDYDAAGEWLRTIYGELNPRVEASGELRTILQPGADAADMLAEAYLYVPASCASGEACGVHVAFHGCLQSSEYVGDAFAAGSGLNEWAESNRLLVLYPQVASSKLAPMNPNGCWDWWGYTTEDYATQSGPQVIVVKRLLDQIAGETL